MKPCALGLTIMARSHGSLNVSPGLTWPGACATIEGWSPMRLTAIVVAGGTIAPAGAAGAMRTLTGFNDAVRTGGAGPAIGA